MNQNDFLRFLMANGLPVNGALSQPPGVLAQKAPQGILSQALNEPLPMEGRLTFLPAKVNKDAAGNVHRELAVPGILASAWNAFTAPGRAYSGNMTDPVGEAINVAGMMNLGGMPSPAVGGPGTLGMNVWHGSPHKFDKFDMSKVGTGEGAQAYGHGLYFAENPGVAGSYAKVLGGREADLVNNGISRTVHINNGDLNSIRSNLIQEGFPAERITPELQAAIKKVVQNTSPDGTVNSAALRAYDELKKLVPDKGNLYKVDLPDSSIAKMLDWDAPLSQQPAVVELLKKNGMWDGPGKWGEAKAATGKELIGILETKMGEKKLSEWLRSNGIPGVRYLDQGSRYVTPPRIESGPKGHTVYWGNDPKPVDTFKTLAEAQDAARQLDTRSRNYVVFDDQLPKIIGRE